MDLKVYFLQLRVSNYSAIADFSPSLKGKPLMSDDRPDDPAAVMAHAGRYTGGTALIVLGGASAAGWERLSAEVQPDVLLIANGVNAVIKNADYWIISENMNFTAKHAAIGDARAIEFMEMFHRDSGAKTKLISHRSWDLLRNTDRCVSIRRTGYEPGRIPADFSYRVYGEGFMSGWIFADRRVMRMRQRVGNAGCQLLHMAGILGVDKIHTIGFDMTFRDPDHHHFFPYPAYQVDHFRNQANFINYRGTDTQVIWVECAKFLKTMEPYIKRAGIQWIDRSEGLLKVMGLECAQ